MFSTFFIEKNMQVFSRLPEREMPLHHADPCPRSSPAEMMLRCSSVIRLEDWRMWQPLLLTELIKPRLVLNKSLWPCSVHKRICSTHRNAGTIRWDGAVGQKRWEIKKLKLENETFRNKTSSQGWDIVLHSTVAVFRRWWTIFKLLRDHVVKFVF